MKITAISKSLLSTTLLSASLLLSGPMGAKAEVLYHDFLDATGGCIIQAHVGDTIQLQLDSSLDLYGLYAANSYSNPLSQENPLLSLSTAYTIKYLKEEDIAQDTDVPVGSDDPYVPALDIISDITQTQASNFYTGVGLSNAVRLCKGTFVSFSCDAPGRTMIKCKKLQTSSTFYEDTLTFIIQIDPVPPAPIPAPSPTPSNKKHPGDS
jgi:hypothetical protein